MVNFKPIQILQSQLESYPIKKGQLIFTTDTYGIYVDISNAHRKEYREITLTTSEEREEILAPIVGFYYETDTNKLFYYNKQWIEPFGIDPNTLKITYTASEDLIELQSGETLSAAFAKLKTAVSKLISHLKDYGNPHKVTKAQIGLGNVENKTSATIRSELTKDEVVSALGYTPPKQDTNTTYNIATETVAGLIKAKAKTTEDAEVAIDASTGKLYAPSGGGSGGGVGKDVSTGSIVGAEIFNDYKNNEATKNYSHAEGVNTHAYGLNSHAEGSVTTASGSNAHAEGTVTTASGNNSHAEGNLTVAQGSNSHAEGAETDASADYSHAEGYLSSARGIGAHAEGYFTLAQGEYSHAEGYYSEVYGDYCHVEGKDTIARGYAQHVQGAYNIEDADGTYIHIVGNGEDTEYRFNAHTLDWDGNAWYAGKVSAGTPESPADPTEDNDLVTKKYVDERARSAGYPLIFGGDTLNSSIMPTSGDGTSQYSYIEPNYTLRTAQTIADISIPDLPLGTYNVMIRALTGTSDDSTTLEVTVDDTTFSISPSMFPSTMKYTTLGFVVDHETKGDFTLTITTPNNSDLKEALMRLDYVMITPAATVIVNQNLSS